MAFKGRCFPIDSDDDDVNGGNNFGVNSGSGRGIHVCQSEKKASGASMSGEKVSTSKVEFPRDETIFRCGVCSNTYSSHPRLRKHISARHPMRKERIWVCNSCGKSYTYIGSLNQHRRKTPMCKAFYDYENDEEEYFCPHCEKSYKTATTYAIHLEKADLCMNVFLKSKHGIKESLRQDEGSRGNDGVIDDTTYRKLSKRKRRIDRVCTVLKQREILYREPGYFCFGCNFRTLRKDHMLRHQATCKDLRNAIRKKETRFPKVTPQQPRLVCSICHNTYSRADNFRRHFRGPGKCCGPKKMNKIDRLSTEATPSVQRRCRKSSSECKNSAKGIFSSSSRSPVKLSGDTGPTQEGHDGSKRITTGGPKTDGILHRPPEKDRFAKSLRKMQISNTSQTNANCTSVRADENGKSKSKTDAKYTKSDKVASSSSNGISSKLSENSGTAKSSRKDAVSKSDDEDAKSSGKSVYAKANNNDRKYKSSRSCVVFLGKKVNANLTSKNATQKFASKQDLNKTSNKVARLKKYKIQVEDSGHNGAPVSVSDEDTYSSRRDLKSKLYGNNAGAKSVGKYAAGSSDKGKPSGSTMNEISDTSSNVNTNTGSRSKNEGLNLTSNTNDKSMNNTKSFQFPGNSYQTTPKSTSKRAAPKSSTATGGAETFDLAMDFDFSCGTVNDCSSSRFSSYDVNDRSCGTFASKDTFGSPDAPFDDIFDFGSKDSHEGSLSETGIEEKGEESHGFNCAICKIDLPTSRTLRLHMLNKHPARTERLFYCIRCGRRYSHKATLYTHFQTSPKCRTAFDARPRGNDFCYECKKVFTHYISFLHHLTSNETCLESYENNVNSFAERNYKKSPREADMTLDSSSSDTIPYTPSEKGLTDDDEKWETVRPELKEKQIRPVSPGKESKSARGFKCHICAWRFKRKDHLKRHLDRKTCLLKKNGTKKPRCYRCDCCKKRYSSWGSLWRHSKNKPWCSIEETTLSAAGDRFGEERVPFTEESDYKEHFLICGHCQGKFRSKDQLSRHLSDNPNCLNHMQAEVSGSNKEADQNINKTDRFFFNNQFPVETLPPLVVMEKTCDKDQKKRQSFQEYDSSRLNTKSLFDANMELFGDESNLLGQKGSDTEDHEHSIDRTFYSSVRAENKPNDLEESLEAESMELFSILPDLDHATNPHHRSYDSISNDDIGTADALDSMEIFELNLKKVCSSDEANSLTDVLDSSKSSKSESRGASRNELKASHITTLRDIFSIVLKVKKENSSVGDTSTLTVPTTDNNAKFAEPFELDEVAPCELCGKIHQLLGSCS